MLVIRTEKVGYTLYRGGQVNTIEYGDPMRLLTEQEQMNEQKACELFMKEAKFEGYNINPAKRGETKVYDWLTTNYIPTARVVEFYDDIENIKFMLVYNYRLGRYTMTISSFDDFGDEKTWFREQWV